MGFNYNFYPSVWADQRKKQDDMVVITLVITKILPSRQIVLLLHESEAEPRKSVITTITYECSGIWLVSIPLFLMCITSRSKWSPEDNYVIAGVVSILLTWVLGDDRFHLLQRIKRPKRNAYIWNLGVNENQPYLPLKLVRMTFSIMKLVQNIPATGTVSLTIV